MATPNSSVNWSTVLPDSSTARFTAAAFVDQWEYSMMWLKASSTVKVMPAFCWSFEPTMKGPPAMEPLETPTSTPFSMTMTDLPARTASTAAHMPAPPAPHDGDVALLGLVGGLHGRSGRGVALAGVGELGRRRGLRGAPGQAKRGHAGGAVRRELQAQLAREGIGPASGGAAAGGPGGGGTPPSGG